MVQIKITAVLFAAMSILPFAVVGAPARNFYDREDVDSSLVRRAYSIRYRISGCTGWGQLLPDPCYSADCGCTGLGLFSCHEQTMYDNCKARNCGCVKLS